MKEGEEKSPHCTSLYPVRHRPKALRVFCRERVFSGNAERSRLKLFQLSPGQCHCPISNTLCEPSLNQSKLIALRKIYYDQWSVLYAVSIYANVIDVGRVAPYAGAAVVFHSWCVCRGSLSLGDRFLQWQIARPQSTLEFKCRHMKSRSFLLQAPARRRQVQRVDVDYKLGVSHVIQSVITFARVAGDVERARMRSQYISEPWRAITTGTCCYSV